MDRVEERARAFLTELLLDVPIARGSGDPHALLAALVRAAEWTPVVGDHPSPVPAWLDEAERVARELGLEAAPRGIRRRRAEVLMLARDFAGALAELEHAAPGDDAVDAERYRWAVAVGRLAIRRQEFETARESLDRAHALRPADWTRALLVIGRAELRLEQDAHDEARRSLHLALEQLPFERVEEQVTVAQALGFLYAARMDGRGALTHLERARQYLRAAGIWAEAVQMDLAVGNLQLSFGSHERAREVLSAGLQAATEQGITGLVPVFQASLARLEGARGRFDAGIAAAVAAADHFARQGNALGYTSMVATVVNFHLQKQDYREAYRTLAVAAAVTRQLGLVQAERSFREQIRALREDVLGVEAFDAMAAELLRERQT